MKNVYDFDKTLYHGNSTFDFYLFELHRHPSICRYWPKLIYNYALYGMKVISITEAKKSLYCFLQDIKDVDKEVSLFWDNNISKIHCWYYELHQSDDLVISGSPEFLLKDICTRLNITNLIASKVDKQTGEVLSKNCSKEQKVVYMRQCGYNPEEINNFYSDSYDDVFLARYAKKAYRIINGKITDWDKF